MYFKTIDELVEYNMKGGSGNDFANISATFIYITTHLYEEILETLKCNTNVPSVHDLTIIKYVHKQLPIYNNPEYQEILKLYSNRK